METLKNGMYEVRYIKTKGKLRKIVTYGENGTEIRRYHEKVVEFLEKNVAQSKFAKAYKKGTSIYDNAEAHLYNDYFLIMDIKDFFPSIDHRYLAKALYREINKFTPISYLECNDVVEKCSVTDNGLPLGLVSSPILANIYLKEFDGLLYGWLKKLELNNPIYTRYADDIVISYRLDGDSIFDNRGIIDKVAGLLSQFSLQLNKKKTKNINLKHSKHVRITGINIVLDDETQFRYISVGKKLKNYIFWKTLEIYDNGTQDYYELLKIKGLWSYALSIEKKGFDNCFSDNMRNLIYERGYSSLAEMINNLNM